MHFDIFNSYETGELSCLSLYTYFTLGVLRCAGFISYFSRKTSVRVLENLNVGTHCSRPLSSMLATKAQHAGSQASVNWQSRLSKRLVEAQLRKKKVV